MMQINLAKKIYNQPSFSGIYANYGGDNTYTYLNAFRQNPQEHQLNSYATRIFRELPTTLAVAKLIQNKPTDIHILGCSDGSQSYAYAIVVKEELKDKTNSVRVIGVDKEPFLVEMAKTGYLVCTDQEKIWANDPVQSKSPLAGEGWDKYLKIQKTAPPNFQELTKKYPVLNQITRDPVSSISIENGMHWYKVNKTGLPELSFIHDDMRNYVKQSFSSARQQIYVVANSLGYLALENHGRPLLNVLQNIQNQNYKNKSTYVILGNVEHQVFRKLSYLSYFIAEMGFKPVSINELKQMGVKELDKAANNIWKLSAKAPYMMIFL